MNKTISKKRKNNINDSEELLSKFIRPAKIVLPAPTFKKNAGNEIYYLPRRTVHTEQSSAE